MPISSRGYTPDADFPKIQRFLFEIHKETGTFQNWLPSRFENNHLDHVEDIRIWEESDGGERRVIAMANPETKTIYFIQIRPGHPTLLDEVIRWIEAHLASKKTNPDEEQKIHIINLKGDKEREAALGNTDSSEARPTAYSESGTSTSPSPTPRPQTASPSDRFREGRTLRSWPPTSG